LYVPQLTQDDSTLGTLIDRAEGALAMWLRWPIPDGFGRPTLEQQTYTFFLNGPAYADFMRLDLPIRPIQSITSIHDDPDRVYGADTLVAASDYEVDKNKGEIFLLPQATHSWNHARRTIKVVCDCGLVESQDVEVAKQAIVMLVKHWWELRHTQGLASATQGGQSQARRSEALPVHVTQLVSHWRTWGAEVA